MKIAFVGKGGSGKTTLTSLFARYLARRGLPVLALDADINQHLGVALGLDETEAAGIPAMGAGLPSIKEYLRGSNPRVSSADTMVKTTPPGPGSRLLRLLGDDPIHARLAREVDGVGLMVTGPFAEEDLGVACYHSKLGAVELYLNHLVDGPGEYAIVDMTAGADSFASGMFTRFDVTFLVAEPTRKSIGVYRQYAQYAADYGVTVKVVGNKVHGAEDLDFLREHVGSDLVACVDESDFVRALERGRPLPFDALEDRNRSALERLRETVDATPQDWARFTRQAVDFHIRNAHRWANGAVGEDLTAQVDPDFRLGPEALAQAR